MKTPTSVSSRQRRFFTVLPLLVLPFLTLAFWALGGGNDTPRQFVPGLNLELPEPRLKEISHKDKLGLYEALNSAHPNISPDTLLTFQTRKRLVLEGHGVRDTTSGVVTPVRGSASPEADIQKRLSQLTALVNAPSPEMQRRAPPMPVSTSLTGKSLRQDIDRLERLMQNMNGHGNSPDPEVRQVEGMLDRILDIQHPERVKARLIQQSKENIHEVYRLQPRPTSPTIGILQARQVGAPTVQQHPLTTGIRQSPAYQGWQEGHAPPGRSIRAAIQEKQEVSPGSVVRIRLLQEAHLGGQLLRPGTLLHGTCQIEGERLLISITAAVVSSSVLPVALTAYDLDGMEGLYVPGALRQQGVSRGAEQVISQGLPFTSVSPSLGAQATAAGIDAARNVFRQKVRQVKVILPAGHQMLLLDQKKSF